MKNNFVSDYLSVNVSRMSNDEKIQVEISSDYSGSDHKSQLYVNEKSIATELERFWKSIKTKKLLFLNVSFGEIDHYDDECNIYYTPSVTIKRGLKKARISENTHGSIPKDWSYDFVAVFADTSTSTPIMEVVKAALGSKLTPNMEKELKKALKPLLRKEKKYANVEAEEVEY